MCASQTFPKRPPRIVLFHDIRPFYFITFATHRRLTLLASKRVHDALVQYALRGYRDYGVATGRYVLMPDHAHLFVCLPGTGCSLARWVGGLKHCLGRAVSPVHDVDAVWQRGFFDHVLRGAESYSEKWEYVRLNPVRAGLCAKPEDWPWQGEIVPVRW